MPGADATLHLSTQTMAWLADPPDAPLCIYSWLVVAAGALFTEDGVSAFEDAPVSGAVPCVPLLSGAPGL